MFEGGDVFHSPCVFFLNNLRTVYIRMLKLLHLFNIVVVNKFCLAFCMHRVR